MTPPDYRRPEAAECAPFHFAYIGEVPDGDVLQTMERQLHETTGLLEAIPAGKADFAYAPGKWSIKQVVGHVTDAERIFAYRALRIARGDPTPLPGFDENLYVPASAAERRSLIDLLAEFHAVRRASLSLFHHLPAESVTRTGIVSGAVVSVRALAWVITGHELHHQRILKDRYLA
jgi:hypothetical protein